MSNRRKFLKNTGAFASGSMTLSSLSWAHILPGSTPPSAIESVAASIARLKGILN